MENQKKRILVVDDEKINLVGAKALLAEEYDLILINSGKQCIEYLQKHTPDLILLDIAMPEMDGWQVMKNIQDNPEWKDIPVVFLTADSSSETEAACFDAGGVDFAIKPVQPLSLRSRIRRILELEAYRNNLKRMVAKQEKNINDMKYEFIVTMAKLVDNRDGTAEGHVERTSEIVGLLGKELWQRGMFSSELNETYIEKLRLAAPMHDIGKIKIPDTILLKPGKLTEEEYSMVKGHTYMGKQLIEEALGAIGDSELVRISADIAAYHHEKYNGNGYPEGLKGSEIPLCARIMAIADVYDALKGQRCYKEAFPLDEVYEIMKDDAGRHFDPEIMDVFLDMKEKIEEIG